LPEVNSSYAVKSMTAVMVATLLSRVLGFFREMAVAYRFGATMEADAYLVAVLVPTFLFLAFGDALKSTFITVFTPLKNREDAPQFLNTLFLYVGGALLLLSLLGVIFAPQLVFILAPGFEGETFELTVELMRILAPGIFFVGLSGLAMGFLHSHQRFLSPSLKNVPHNLVVIFSSLYLGLHYGVHGLAWGTLFGITTMLLIQVPSIKWSSFKFRPGFAFKHPAFRKIAALLPAILFSSAVMELKHLLDRLFASFLDPGSLAALNYAERIYLVPQAILVFAVIAILYPTLVELLNKKDHEAFVAQVKWGLSLFSFLIVPIAAGLILLRFPLVELLFQRGAFDAAATDLTTYALLFYAPALIGFSFHSFCNRIFFALQEVRVLVNSNSVNDKTAAKLARDIAREVEDELQYPGEVQVTVIREARYSEVAH